MNFSIDLLHYSTSETVNDDFGVFTIAYNDKWQWSLLRITFAKEYGEVSWFTFTIKNESK